MEREKWRTFLWTRVVEVSFPTAPAARDSCPLHSSSVYESEYRGVGHGPWVVHALCTYIVPPVPSVLPAPPLEQYYHRRMCDNTAAWGDGAQENFALYCSKSKPFISNSGTQASLLFVYKPPMHAELTCVQI